MKMMWQPQLLKRAIPKAKSPADKLPIASCFQSVFEDAPLRLMQPLGWEITSRDASLEKNIWTHLSPKCQCQTFPMQEQGVMQTFS